MVDNENVSKYQRGENVFIIEPNDEDRFGIYDSRTGLVYESNETAKRIIEFLVTPKNISAILSVIVEEYDVDKTVALEDIKELLEDLVSFELVMRLDG